MSATNTEAKGAALALWRHIFRDGHGYIGVSSGQRQGGDLLDYRQAFYRYPDQIDEAEAWLRAQSDAGREAYFCAHLLTEPVRQKEYAAPLLALYVDGDGAQVLPGLPPPTAIVDSSPGRQHYYWALTRPAEPEVGERLNRRLALAMGADKSGYDLSQTLRPPGTVNYKYDARPPVELVYVNDHAYDPDELDRMLPELPEAVARAEWPPKPADWDTPPPPASGPPVRLKGRDLAVWNGEHYAVKEADQLDRSASLFRIGRLLHRAGLSRELIVNALHERDHNLVGWHKYCCGRRDGWERYNEIVDRLEKDSVTLTETEEPDFPLTELGNAKRLMHRHGGDLRYCRKWKTWLAWDRRRWQRDADLEVERRAKETILTLYDNAREAQSVDKQKQLVAHTLRSQRGQAIREMERMARSEAGVEVDPLELDANPYLLNAKNGTIDLRTGDLLDQRRHDLITKLVPFDYVPEAQCPRFEAFLKRVMDGDEGKVRYLQQLIGMSLTGDTSERIIVICHGHGANGKSVLLAAVRGVLGEDYALQTPVETLIAKRQSTIPNDLARLPGSRFVTASETEAGDHLSVAKIKSIAGGDDLITARFMRGEWFQFKPQFTLWLATNHRPVIDDITDSIWDRVKLIPFTVRIEGAERDPHLLETLIREEASGILAWAVRGCIDWLEHGLQEPDAVRIATEAYREESDLLADFLAERCATGVDEFTMATPLYLSYQNFCEFHGAKPFAQKRFNELLSDHGFVKSRATGGRVQWKGLSLRLLRSEDGAKAGDGAIVDWPLQAGLTSNPQFRKGDLLAA